MDIWTVNHAVLKMWFLFYRGVARGTFHRLILAVDLNCKSIPSCCLIGVYCWWNLKNFKFTKTKPIWHFHFSKSRVDRRTFCSVDDRVFHDDATGCFHSCNFPYKRKLSFMTSPFNLFSHFSMISWMGIKVFGVVSACDSCIHW